MRRRDLLGYLLGAAALSPRTSPAQQKAVPVIGVLDVADPTPFLKVFREALRAHGYVEGQNVHLEIRSAEGDPRRVRDLADELVRLKVDVIVARLNLATSAAKAATSTIPIVMAPGGAPIETGLITSLAHPGGNVTGASVSSPELSGKRMQLMRELLPSLRRITVLGNAGDAFTKPLVAEMEAAGRTLGVAVAAIMVKSAGEFPDAFAVMDRDHADAVIMQASLPIKPMVELAVQHRIVPFATSAPAVAAGALMTYSASWSQAYRKAAVYVDKILRGAKPADLPVEEPTEFELVINLKTAKALGLTVPPSLLARADEVIE